MIANVSKWRVVLCTHRTRNVFCHQFVLRSGYTWRPMLRELGLFLETRKTWDAFVGVPILLLYAVALAVAFSVTFFPGCTHNVIGKLKEKDTNILLMILLPINVPVQVIRHGFVSRWELIFLNFWHYLIFNFQFVLFQILFWWHTVHTIKRDKILCITCKQGKNSVNEFLKYLQYLCVRICS